MPKKTHTIQSVRLVASQTVWHVCTRTMHGRKCLLRQSVASGSEERGPAPLLQQAASFQSMREQYLKNVMTCHQDSARTSV